MRVHPIMYLSLGRRRRNKYSVLYTHKMIGRILEILLDLFRSKRLKALEEELRLTKSELRSMYVKHGQKLEQLVPLSKYFPEGKFLFLGEPLDGVIFGEDTITFIEIKSGNSQLNPKQKRIKELIEKKSITFKLLRY